MNCTPASMRRSTTIALLQPCSAAISGCPELKLYSVQLCSSIPLALSSLLPFIPLCWTSQPHTLHPVPPPQRFPAARAFAVPGPMGVLRALAKSLRGRQDSNLCGRSHLISSQTP